MVGPRQTGGPQARLDHGGGRCLVLRFSRGAAGTGGNKTRRPAVLGRQAPRADRRHAPNAGRAVEDDGGRQCGRQGGGAVRGSCIRWGEDPGLAVWPRSPRPCTREAPAGGVRNGPPAGANVLPGGHRIRPRVARSKQSSAGVRLHPPPRRARPPRRRLHLSLAARGGRELATGRPPAGPSTTTGQRGCRRGRRTSNEGSPGHRRRRRPARTAGTDKGAAKSGPARSASGCARGVPSEVPCRGEIWTDGGTRSGSLTSGSPGAGGSPSGVGDRTTPATDCKRGWRRGRGRSVVNRAAADVTYVIATGASTVGDHSALARAAQTNTVAGVDPRGGGGRAWTSRLLPTGRSNSSFPPTAKTRHAVVTRQPQRRQCGGGGD